MSYTQTLTLFRIFMESFVSRLREDVNNFVQQLIRSELIWVVMGSARLCCSFSLPWLFLDWSRILNLYCCPAQLWFMLGRVEKLIYPSSLSILPCSEGGEKRDREKLKVQKGENRSASLTFSACWRDAHLNFKHYIIPRQRWVEHSWHGRIHWRTNYCCIALPKNCDCKYFVNIHTQHHQYNELKTYLAYSFYLKIWTSGTRLDFPTKGTSSLLKYLIIPRVL